MLLISYWRVGGGFLEWCVLDNPAPPWGYAMSGFFFWLRVVVKVGGLPHYWDLKKAGFIDFSPIWGPGEGWGWLGGRELAPPPPRANGWVHGWVGGWVQHPQLRKALHQTWVLSGFTMDIMCVILVVLGSLGHVSSVELWEQLIVELDHPDGESVGSKSHHMGQSTGLIATRQID